MAFDTPLNHRQLAVLRWISDGCPDGRWTDFNFKLTATALASRRLVTVSKRGGVWSAAMLAAGEYYLTKGQYPEGHWVQRGIARSIRAMQLRRQRIQPSNHLARRGNWSLR